MSKDLIPFGEMQNMGTAIAKSGLFPGIKNQDQALALMLLCQAEGLHPATALRDYHVIQGRPALKADAMLARFLSRGGKLKWTEFTDKRVAAVFSHPQSGEIEIDWTIERAKAAGLTGKDVWKQYPRNMLKARVISDGVRMMDPGANSGLYTPEEVADFAEEPKPIKDVTPPVEKEVVGELIVDRTEEIKALIASKGKDIVKVLEFIRTKYKAYEFSDLNTEQAEALIKLIGK